MHIIAGSCRGRQIRTVIGQGYRPAMGKVREAVFSILESRGVVWSSVRFLDVFAGSGSLGFEALSRGAVFADFLEKDHAAAECLKKNAESLGLAGRCRIHEDDAFHLLRHSPSQPYQVICVDPPYGESLLKPALSYILRKGWLAEEGFLIAEVEKQLSIDAHAQEGLTLETERFYGNTRILIWAKDA